MSNENRYPVVIYLNQKYVFDILAIMEQGFSQLETVKTTTGDQEERSKRYSGEIGVRNVFSFLGIGLGGERGSHDQQSTQHETSSEKVYTPNSLFARVRERLRDEQKIVSSLSSAKPSDFVEFQAVLHKNPLVDALQTVLSFGRLAQVFSEDAQPQHNKPPQHAKPPKPAVQPKSGETRAMEQLQALVNELLSAGSIDLLAVSPHKGDSQIVLTVDKAFLDDRSMSDLVDGEYTVVGKVTRAIARGESETINLLRNTSLGKVQRELMEQFTSALSGMKQYGINMPDMSTEIEPPVLQVLPIAIFV